MKWGRRKQKKASDYLDKRKQKVSILRSKHKLGIDTAKSNLRYMSKRSPEEWVRAEYGQTVKTKAQKKQYEYETGKTVEQTYNNDKKYYQSLLERNQKGYNITNRALKEYSNIKVSDLSKRQVKKEIKKINKRVKSSM